MGHNLTSREILVVWKERIQAGGGYYEKIVFKNSPSHCINFIHWQNHILYWGNVYLVSYKTNFMPRHFPGNSVNFLQANSNI